MLSKYAQQLYEFLMVGKGILPTLDPEEGQPYLKHVYDFLCVNEYFTFPDLVESGVPGEGESLSDEDRDYLQQVLDFWVSGGAVIGDLVKGGRSNDV